MTSSLGKLRNHLETSHSDYNGYEILPFWQGVTISPDRATFKHVNFPRQYFTPHSLCHIWLYRLGTAQGGDTSHIGYHRFGAYQFSQFSSVAQSCMTLCDHMNHSTPGLPVHHQLPESTQTHVHWVGDAPTISSSVIPFSSWLQSFPASGSFPISQVFTSGGQSIGISPSASVLPVNIFGCTVVWILTHLLILITNTTIRIQNNFITPETSLVLYFLVKLTLIS